jgi:hypothetical protein
MVKVLKTNACSDQEDPILAVIDMLRFGEDMLADMYFGEDDDDAEAQAVDRLLAPPTEALEFWPTRAQTARGAAAALRLAMEGLNLDEDASVPLSLLCVVLGFLEGSDDALELVRPAREKIAKSGGLHDPIPNGRALLESIFPDRPIAA